MDKQKGSSLDKQRDDRQTYRKTVRRTENQKCKKNTSRQSMSGDMTDRLSE